MLLAASMASGEHGEVIEAHRSFFGVHRITRLERRTDQETIMANLLYHDITLHGEQRVDPTSGATVEAGTPVAYFHRDGFLGDLFAAVGSRFDHVGTVGLGAGWEVVEMPPGPQPWTDDYSNIVGGLDW